MINKDEVYSAIDLLIIVKNKSQPIAYGRAVKTVPDLSCKV